MLKVFFLEKQSSEVWVFVEDCCYSDVCVRDSRSEGWSLFFTAAVQAIPGHSQSPVLGQKSSRSGYSPSIFCYFLNCGIQIFDLHKNKQKSNHALQHLHKYLKLEVQRKF